MTFFCNTDPDRSAIFRRIFARELPDIAFAAKGDDVVPANVSYLFSWSAPEPDAYPALEVLFGLGAGIDQFFDAPEPCDAVGTDDRAGHHRNDAGICDHSHACPASRSARLSGAAKAGRVEGPASRTNGIAARWGHGAG